MNKITLILAAFILSSCAGLGSGGLFGSSDQEIYQQIKQRYLATEDPTLRDVEIEVQKKHVILNGYVHKIRQSDAAEMMASQVPGVKDVENNLVVRSH